jgi:hypothetical protein
MNYRVFWYPEAQHLLDALLQGSGSRDLITTAANKIDLQLASDPYSFGESRGERMRIGFERPLAVQFEVLRDVSTVIVYNVRLVSPRRH